MHVPSKPYEGKFYQILSPVSVATVLLLLSSSVVASDVDPLEVLLEKYSTDQIQESIQRHTIVSNATDSLESIPTPYLYRAAFLRIILNAEISKQEFSPRDWSIIEALPDHNDIRFEESNLGRMKANCDRISEITSAASGADNTRQMAMLAQNAERRALQELSDHYEEVLRSLSNDGRSRVSQEVTNLSANSDMVWTTIDLVKMSDDIPEYVAFVIEQSCSDIRSSPTRSPQSKLLKDAHLNWDRFEK